MNWPIILTDLDNTLYNWVDFFGPSFRAMVHVISKKTLIDEETILDDFKDVFRSHGMIEYPYSVNELQSLQSISEEARNELATLTNMVFNQVGMKHLIPYPGVIETLTWAKRANIRVICVTNAPINLAVWRLEHLKIYDLFYGLAGLESEKKSKSRVYKAHLQKWILTKEELKPYPAGYLKIVNTLNILCSNVYVIGDSLSKDIQPALDIGAVGVWASYGKDCDPKNLETIRRVTSLSGNRVEIEEKVNTIKPTFEVASYLELKSIINNPPQMFLPGF